MQEIKPYCLLLLRSVWTRLLSRCRCCLPPVREAAAVREGTPMTILKPVFVFFLIGLASCYGNALVLQELQYERGGSSNGRSNSFIGSSLENNPEHAPIGTVNWAAARTGPRSFVHDQFFGTSVVHYGSVCSNVASRREWLDRAERESGECNWRSVWGLRDFKDDRLTPGWGQYGFADRQIQAVINLAINEPKPVEVHDPGIALPIVIRDINRCHARLDYVRGHSPEIINDVRRCQKMSVRVNNESSAVDQIDGELSFQALLPAHHRDNGVLNLLNLSIAKMNSSGRCR